MRTLSPRVLFLRFAGCCLFAVAGCGEDPQPLTVRAASSLTDALPQAVAAFRERDTGDVELAFDASSRLARQIVAGAPCDLVITADGEWMDHLASNGALREGARTNLLGNELVVVVPASATAAPDELADLAQPEMGRIALAGENVPAGRYADAALERSGMTAAMRDRIVRGDTVRAALAWVARGEADAGFVYRTDALAEPRVRVAFAVPAALHPEIVYPAAVTARTEHPERAMRLFEFLQGETAGEIFGAAGFEPDP